jgi:amidase
VICFLGAVELARLIRTRQLSAREALAAHLAQIERVDARVNALVTLVPDKAFEAASRADEAQARGEPLGPLHGLPVAHKDLFETRSIRTTFGSPLFADYVPAHDDIVVQRMSQAGAITIGKTNTPEFGAGSQTFNSLFGATRNPYDLTKTCGGSSGGAAVALACGMTPVATGSDVGGSLRNPAAFCNVAGFRPSSSTLNTAGCLGRSVADLALALSTIMDEGLARPLDRTFAGARIAWFKDLGGVPFDRAVRAIVDGHCRTFESLGCVVEQSEPDFAPAETAFRVLRARNSAQLHGAKLRSHPDSIKAVLRREIEDGLRLTAAEIARAEAAGDLLRRGFRSFFERYDYFILPTTQLPPFDIGIEWPTELEGVKFDTYIDWMKSCWYISTTGHPAASVPAGFTPEGLPVGLQIVGREGLDFAVLQLAHAFEQATGFGGSRPPASDA